MKILAIIGARPQFIKHAPFELLCKGKVNLVTLHTGQHYDKNMSQVIFDELKMSPPTYMLNTGGGNHGIQTGRMLQEIEPIVISEQPDFVLVYGDTNSTLAGALVGAKLNIPVIHVEAGLRSFNKAMPEEINRILTDHISSLLFTSTTSAIENLQNEGIVRNVHLVGDIMQDAVNLAVRVNKDQNSHIVDYPYYFVTVHRPYNTDNKERLELLLSVLNQLDEKVLFPIHPRTRNLAQKFGITLESYKNIEFLDPLSYFANIRYLKNAKHAITDSGGLQKEAYILRTPCITVRSETEWTETLNESWNILCFENLEEIPVLLKRAIGDHTEGLYGSGQAAQDILNIIYQYYSNKIL